MKSISQGNLRGDVTYNTSLMMEFEQSENISFTYKKISKRIFAQTDIKGEPTPDKISVALKLLRETINSEGKRIIGKNICIKTLEFIDDSKVDVGSGVGFQLWGCKAGFNANAEPAIAVYEMQYNERITKVQLELDIIE
jgi:hypothetical protein